MASDQRKDTPSYRGDAAVRGVRKQRSLSATVPTGVRFSGPGSMRRSHHSVARQKVVRPFKVLKDKKKIRAWAAGNAYTLLFLAAMFTITWIIYFVMEVVF